VTERPDDAELESLLEYLRDTRSLDFTGYKRPSLSRRIRKRMHEVGVERFGDYRDVLESDPAEQAQLVDTILINVTAFFRDEDAWQLLAADVVPGIVEAAGDGPIRVWSAGCASGEEAYSLAMVIADQMGVEAFKDQVKIFATDTDESALAEARRGVYTERQLEPVSAERVERYFEAVDDGFAFRTDCRRQVIFGRNDVTADAPISRLDLLVCRNVLMYLVTDTQRHVLHRFRYALKPGGHLFLGKAETVTAHSELFEPVNPQLRLFRRAPGSETRHDLGALVDRVGSDDALHELALAATPVAQIVLDVDGRVSGINTRARAMFGVTGDDIGRSFREVDVAHGPVELRPHIEQAYTEGRPVVLHDVSRPLADGQLQFLEISIAPLRTSAGVDLGVSVSFADVTELGRTRRDLEQSGHDLEVANRSLRSANEELETANEELQSTNEELETTNEELQSANEELETMNEELQSANEELETMNEELLTQTGQIESARRFLTSVVDAIPIGVAVVDEQLDVVLWNQTAEHLFGLRAADVVDRSFLALDFGLPVGPIGPLLHATSGDDVPRRARDSRSTVVEAVDSRGQRFSCRVSVGRIGRLTGGDTTLMVLMEPIDGESSAARGPATRNGSAGEHR